jgi:hypothetical protein
LADCGGSLSEEHYFSKALTRAFVRADGASTIRLLRPGKPERNVPPEQAFHAPILCQRHNSALTGLDRTSACLFDGIREGVKLIPAYPCRAVNGTNLERWMLKVICGVLADEQKPMPLQWLRWLFGYEDIAAPLGLHMHADISKPMTGQIGIIQFGLFRNAGGISGAVLTLDAVSFTLDLEGKGLTVQPSEVGSIRMLRPLGIWFDQAGATRFYLAFDWGAAHVTDDSLAIDVLDVGPRSTSVPIARRSGGARRPGTGTH